MERRQEAIEEEIKLKAHALEKISTPLCDENKSTLAKLYIKELRTKKG